MRTGSAHSPCRHPHSTVHWRILLLVASCVSWACLCLHAPPAAAEHLQRLLDDWNTLRGRVDDRGIILETVNTTDVLSNVSGGLRKRTSLIGDLDLLLTLDMEPLAGWEDATLFVYGLGLYGRDPSGHIGDAQTVSSIAAPTTWRLFEAWYQQNLMDERFSLLAGLYDVTSEFNVIRAASELFLNSSFGTNPEFASSGRNGLSTFPFTSLGLRAQAALTPRLSLRAVLADGVPGDPGDPNGTDIVLQSEDGVLLASELAYYIPEREPEVHGPEQLGGGGLRRLLFRRLGRAAELDYDAKYALGAWYYSTELNDLDDRAPDGRPVRRDGTYGVYALLEHRVYREPYKGRDLDEGLVAFLQLGYADPRVNRFSAYVGGGLVYTGLIPGRELDEVGFGFALARNGPDFKSAQRAAGLPVNNEEVALEWTYAAFLTRELIVQPDIQYVINPGTDPSVKNALVIGARVELHLNWFK